MFLEPCEEQGALPITWRHMNTPKAVRYQARINLVDPLVFACRVFAVLFRTADHGCFIWVSVHGSSITAVLFFHRFLKQKLKNERNL